MFLGAEYWKTECVQDRVDSREETNMRLRIQMSTFISMIILFTMFGDETAWGEGKGIHMCTSTEKHLGHPVSLLGKQECLL